MTDAQLSTTLEYKLFTGAMNYTLPLLRVEGFVPASTAHIMHAWLDKRITRGGAYCSGDAVIYHPNGRLGILWDSEDVRKMEENTISFEMSCDKWGEELAERLWKSGNLENVFSKREVDDYVDRAHCQKDDVKKNPVWLCLARRDQGLLDAYVDEMVSDCVLYEPFTCGVIPRDPTIFMKELPLMDLSFYVRNYVRTRFSSGKFGLSLIKLRGVGEEGGVGTEHFEYGDAHLLGVRPQETQKMVERATKRGLKRK